MADQASPSSIPQNRRPSTAASSNDYRYDVFLNHRGIDTKKGFTGHLYNSLRSHGLRVFLDKQEMQEGDDLTTQIISAINTSSVQVAIFSQNYAESNWLLKELVLMLESLKSGATIIPVFHGVKPADLRWTEGEFRGYAQGLHKLKIKTDKGQPRYDPDTIAEWRSALSRVADRSGFELDACNGDEGELAEKIKERVLKIVKKRRFNVPKYESGLAEKMKDFEGNFLLPLEQGREKHLVLKTVKEDRENPLVAQSVEQDRENPLVAQSVEQDRENPQVAQSVEQHRENPLVAQSVEQDRENPLVAEIVEQDREKPLVVGIVGLGGVGKTTLARELFHKKNSSFNRSYFFSDVRESSLESLLPKLVDGLTSLDPQIKGKSVDEGRQSLKEHTSLVVLDGIDCIEQLKTLLQITKDVPSNSLILITSRHKDVLIPSVEEASIYELTPLNIQQSRKLFCFHAFGQAAGPSPGFEYLVDEFLTVCDGLPLSLKVLGAFLHGKEKRSYWEDQLDKVQQTLPHEIEKRLKISYEALNEEEKQMFLDIACVFIGESTDTAIRIWKGSGWRGLLGFQSLLEKQLVELDSQNCINMHDHLKDMGRTIAEEIRLRRAPRPVTVNNAGLLQDPSVVTELPRNIDDLLQQSSVIKEIRGFMLMIIIILVIMMAMMIGSIPR